MAHWHSKARAHVQQPVQQTTNGNRQKFTYVLSKYAYGGQHDKHSFAVNRTMVRVV